MTKSKMKVSYKSFWRINIVVCGDFQIMSVIVDNTLKIRECIDAM